MGVAAANAVILVDRLRPPRPGHPHTSGGYHRWSTGAAEADCDDRRGYVFEGIVSPLATGPASGAGFSLAFGLAAGPVRGTLLTPVVLPVAVPGVTRARASP